MELQVPWLQGRSPLYACSLRSAVKAFVEQYARRIVLPEWQYSATTSIYLVDLVVPAQRQHGGEGGGDAAERGAAAGAHSGSTTIKLHIYEERSYGATVCDQCRCMGEHPQGTAQRVCSGDGRPWVLIPEAVGTFNHTPPEQPRAALWLHQWPLRCGRTWLRAGAADTTLGAHGRTLPQRSRVPPPRTRHLAHPAPRTPRPAGWQHHPVSRSRWHFVVPCAATLADNTTLAGVVEAYDRGEPVTGATIAEPEKVRKRGGVVVGAAATSVAERPSSG